MRNYKPSGLLKPLPVPNGPWQEISYDHIVGLPISKGFDSIFVVVDRLTKMAHFIPTVKTATAEDLADLFLHYVWKLHGLPLKTVSDRGSLFTGRFLSQLYARLNIKGSFSSGYHPQTDGQTERINQILEQYLRVFLDERQSNWADLLPLAEFAYNNAHQESIKTSPFFANYGFHPTLISIAHPVSQVPKADEYANLIQEVQEEAKAAMLIAQDRHKRYYDARHSEEPAIQVGDMVWLESTNIKTARPSQKLEHRRLGPYEVTHKISEVAFRLKLPSSMKNHPVFHVSQLTPVREDKIGGREPEDVPTPEVLQDEDRYKIEMIKNARKRNGKMEYLVHWAGYGPEERSWVSYHDLGDADELIDDYFRANPKQAKVHRYKLQKRA